MNIGEFSVQIPEGYENSLGYVFLNHNTQYKLEINSNSPRRCAAVVTIDGKNAGTFRINAFGKLILERPSGENGRFTFFKDGTIEANQAGLSSVPENVRGLVTVLFKPEKWQSESQPEQIAEDDYLPPWLPYTLPQSPYTPPWKPTKSHDSETRTMSMGLSSSNRSSSNSPSSGGTGLSGSSNQRFKTVGNLDYDESSFVSINLRLVCGNTENDIRPLKDFKIKSNPVPAPIS